MEAIGGTLSKTNESPVVIKEHLNFASEQSESNDMLDSERPGCQSK